MKIIVCGGRAFTDHVLVDLVLGAIHHRYVVTELATGDALGADAIAESWGFVNSIPRKIFKANWFKHGKAAGPIRNKQMLEDFKPDAVVAFAGGKGTAGMVKLAEGAGVYVYKFN